MWRFAVVVVVLAGCGSEPEEECPNSSSFDCGRADDWWRPAQHASIVSLNVETLVCARSEWDSVCGNAEGDCCCGGTRQTNRITTPVEPAQCSTACIGLDEPTCLVTANCFVARESGTNGYVGCYSSSRRGYTTPCAMRDTADFCTGDDVCAALYTSTGTDAWQFSACADE